MIEQQKNYEELQRRREELRRNREMRAVILKRRRKRKRRQAFLCVCILALTVLLVIGFVRFPAQYRATQTAKLEQKEMPVETTPEALPAVADQNETQAAQSQTAEQQRNETSFSQFYYYEPDHLDRYQAYSQLHPELQAEDVVWRVNSRLDLAQFTDAQQLSADQLNNDPLIIVNKYHKVPEDYQPPDLVQNEDGCMMRAAVQKAFDAMKQAAREQGYVIRAVSGYRSVSYQEGLYQSYLQTDSRENVDRYSARAGFSEHHTGLAVDVFGSVDGLEEFENTEEYEWVLQHGHQYGFIIRYTARWEDVTGYQDEPWHLRYVGEEAATRMKEQQIGTLEEYRDKYVEHQENPS